MSAVGKVVRRLCVALGAVALMGASQAPGDGDAFSKLAARAEAGDATLDFRALRLAWLDSAQRRRHVDIAPLARELSAAAQAQDTAKVLAAARAILAADYIDM